ncbi:hypothetical protein GRAN_1422 [Granulicella sibirica]|uniref:Uncharacterized protein n=1 Tax=Granulicella sibirica TaxID=2479048 RepID=A0A4Q0T565_9BACT|nr:hypothetical protein GRAN_1422 [Granulicella sibirica]
MPLASLFLHQQMEISLVVYPYIGCFVATEVPSNVSSAGSNIPIVAAEAYGLWVWRTVEVAGSRSNREDIAAYRWQRSASLNDWISSINEQGRILLPQVRVIGPCPIGRNICDPAAMERLDPPRPFSERVEHDLGSGCAIGNSTLDRIDGGRSAHRCVLGYLREVNRGTRGMMEGVATQHKQERAAKNAAQGCPATRKSEQRNADAGICKAGCPITVQVSQPPSECLDLEASMAFDSVSDTASKVVFLPKGICQSMGFHRWPL